MYCRNCGKQVPDQVQFCPSCGADNSNAGQAAPAGGRPLGQAKAAGRLSGLRIVLMILGALHILAFFALPYAELSGMGTLLSYVLPEKLTAMSYISFSVNAASSGLLDEGTMALNVVTCLLPLLLGLGVILTGARRKGYVGSLVLSICLLLIYLFLGAVFGSMDSTGYTATSGGTLACLMAVLTIAVSVVGLVVDSKKK